MLNALACVEHKAVPLSKTDDLLSAVWIDLQDPTAEEVEIVAKATGLHVPTQAEVSEIEASSRLALRDDVLYLSMPLITLANGPRAVSAGFVLCPERLLTV